VFRQAWQAWHGMAWHGRHGRQFHFCSVVGLDYHQGKG